MVHPDEGPDLAPGAHEVCEEMGVFEAKTHFSRIVQQVSEHGASFYITHRGKRVAELRPAPLYYTPLRFAEAAHPDYWMAPDFDAPLTELAAYM